MAQPSRRSLADLPSFWVALFTGFALVTTMAVERRFATRQTRLERMADSREIVRRRSLGEVEIAAPDDATEYEPSSRRVPLHSLAAVLGVAFAVATLCAARQLARPSGSPATDEAAPGHAG